MTIIALETFSNGTNAYAAGQTYEVTAEVAEELILSGVAKEVETSQLVNYTIINDVVAEDVGADYIEASVGKVKSIQEYDEEDGDLLKTTTFKYPAVGTKTIKVIRA